jgi:demethylmenaquinone methyltransferase/2-methoxy-6-polyprenyl-1,4-benzoquinol methylase
METKSQKELAFLHDLYVATDWGERFAAVVDKHLTLPPDARVLYLGAGTGGHALAVQARGENLTLLCADANEECLELARAKAVALNQEVDFQREDITSLSFKENEFDLALGDASFTPRSELTPMLAEMVRVTKTGGTIAWWLPTVASFGEFFSVYWEALLRAGIADRGSEVERLITDLPTIAEVESWAHQAGLESVTSITSAEEFEYESGDQLLASPLITDFLLPRWLQPLPESERDRVVAEVARIADDERHEAPFILTLKATLVVGRKKA